MCFFAVGTIRKPVLMSFAACITVLLRYFTLHVVSVATTWQPVLHSLATDISKWFVSPGRMWPTCAFCESSGRSSSHACDVLAIWLLGRDTRIGLMAFCLFVTGAAAVRKWLVAPESSITQRFASCFVKFTTLSSAATAYLHVLIFGGRGVVSMRCRFVDGYA